ncbi:MAG: hypothetical protein ACM3W4_09070 [Ignavibacteriales bacterium]
MTDTVLRGNRQPRPEEVVIDRQFVRAQARDAVQQFFRPLTAPFQGISKPHVTQRKRRAG